MDNEKITREWRLDPAEVTASLAKVEKIIARANKKDLQGGWSVKVQTTETGEQILILSGSSFKYNGWTFVASVEWLPNGEAITKSSRLYEGEAITSELLQKNLCQHCQTNRARKTQIIVEKDSERKIVGSTCVKDFLGWEFTPTIFADIEEQVEEFFSGSGFAWSSPITDVLVTALGIVEIDGGYSKRSEYGNGTVDIVRGIYFSRTTYGDYREKLKELNNNKLSEITDKANTIIAQVRELTKDVTNDYARNLRSAFTGDIAYQSSFGLIVSAITFVKNEELKEQKRLAEEQAEADLESDITETIQFAPDGSKIAVEGKVIDQFGFETAYGFSTIVTFSANGFRFKWFASGGKDFEIGKVYKVAGTVKGLDDYKGKISTLVTRCKFAEI